MKIQVPIRAVAAAMVFIFISTSFISKAQNIDFGKSYINVTKGVNGGTVEPGDTLEIRAVIVVKAGQYDSCSFSDVIPANTSYVPGTIRVLTNEGKIYKQFTDAINDDAGWINLAAVRINLGYGAINQATKVRRGTIINTYKPSFYSSTCIMVASYRVVVTGAYGTILSLGGGSMTYKSNPGVLTTFTFPARSVAVYKNVGICPNAVGTNALGTEFNGTFGTGKPRNRGISANVPVSYTYSVFYNNGPNDYFYGIANNTSTVTGYTTLNTWAKPDLSATTHRVFQVWDIIGDHTGAVNPLLGNSAADTAANPNAGYMLVINAAYKIDSAFQQTITGLCPNTYYEISCWLRNICSKCGCDSNGKGATGGVGYIPTGVGDSSGVNPNLSFNVDGIDYYTTGSVVYSGQWIKKGFTFLTGPAQNSFTVKFFNNAPGGGGNDWALDDISVATCSPNLAFTPTNNPSICKGNVVDIGSYIRSFFNNYTYFKWQKSIDNGLTYLDAGFGGTGSPTWNGSAYEYFTAYPTFVATQADSGTKFRVVVASTATNIASAGCSFSDATSVLTLNVINCGSALQTDIISFSGNITNNNVQLNWTSTHEDGNAQYIIEKSTDGNTFTAAGSVNGSISGNDLAYYNWSEAYTSSKFYYYRIKLVDQGNNKYSRTIKLGVAIDPLTVSNIPNPFKDKLIADLTVPDAQVIYLQLIDNFGKIVRRQQFAASGGINHLILNDTESLPLGMYILQIQAGTDLINKKVMKQ
ncbi:MAG TPA: T9SS type A sorting domain-containing protein [Flavisolibacter sp.]|nr:T9SS type A sorting domain-containing protein [Flavisolibacter sp.]